MVTNYNDSQHTYCKYNYQKLSKTLYLIDKDAVGNIYIDNGEAYISGLTSSPLQINGFNISLNEETGLNERFSFKKTLSISVRGYTDYRLFEGSYYAIIKTEDNTLYLVNVDFPSKVTHTYNLSNTENQTNFTLTSLSNFPTLKLNYSIESATTVECVGYKTNGIDKLQLLEFKKAKLDSINKNVIATELFKEVVFLKDSCTFTEQYDGRKVTSAVQFNIAFDAYKPSWQYNLLEFIDNRYVAIITPKGSDNKFYIGFEFGLQPAYSISTTSSNGNPSIITVTLTEIANNGNVAAVDYEDISTDDKSWRFVKRLGGLKCYECVGNGLAKFILKQQVDYYGNPTGRYMVLEGYSSYFPNLNIVGTFRDNITFNDSDCVGSSCLIETSLPNTIYFDAATSYTYSLKASCDWSITNTPSNITVSPTFGLADNRYNVTVTQTSTPSESAVTNSFNIECCNSVQIVNTVTQSESRCIRPSRLNINCLAQSVSFTYDGVCQLQVKNINQKLAYSIGNNTLTVQVPRNYTTSSVQWAIEVSNCDCSSASSTVYIIQDKTYEKWVDDNGFICVSGDSYTIQTKYTGVTSSDINQRTSEQRTGTLIKKNDHNCLNTITKWQFNGNYTCVDGNKFESVEEMVSYDGGQNWVKTGETRLGDMVEENSSFCSGTVQYEWRLTANWQCGE